MIKYLFTLLSLCVLTQFNALAQRNLKPGYVVNLKGDTTKGYVDYKEWRLNPNRFDFKADLNRAATETYKLSNALAFGFDGFEHYKRYILSISQDKTDLSALSVGIDSSRVIDTAFLKVVSTGKHVTLFSYIDVNKERFFMSEGNAQPAELIYQLYLNPQQTTQMLKLNSYVRQLQRLATVYQPDNTQLMQQVLSAPYAAKNLQKIIAAINGQKQSASEEQSVRYFAGAGLNISNVNFSGQHVLTSASSSGIFPKLGAGIDVFLNRNVKAWVFRTELSFSGSKADMSYDGEANTPYTQHVKFKQYWAALNPQILYNLYNSKKTKVYLGAGLNATFATYADNGSRTDYYIKNSNTLLLSRDEPFSNPQEVFFSATTKLGFVLNNKIDLYAGYNLPTSITNYAQYSINLSSFQFGINYLFGKK